jgi:hypothetical protein
MGPSATMQKLVEILDIDDENDEKHVGVKQWLIKTMLEVWDTTKNTLEERQPQMARQTKMST